MANVITDSANYTAIANAIRTQLGVATTYLPSEMAAAIAGISGGVTLLSGTAIPAANEGSDGDIYIKTKLKPSLPVGYTEVEYIQSATWAYINLNYYVGPTSRVVLNANITSGNSAFGSTDGDGNVFGVNMDQSVSYVFGTSGTSWTIVASSSAWLGMPITIDLSNTRFSITSDIDSITASFVGASFTSTKPLYLFNHNANGNYYQPQHCAMKVYKLEIYEGETLVHEYIPATNSSNVAGLYDTVGSTFYPSNHNFEAFTPGDPVSSETVYLVSQIYLKVNGAWTNIIGQDIDDVNLGGNS